MVSDCCLQLAGAPRIIGHETLACPRTKLVQCRTEQVMIDGRLPRRIPDKVMPVAPLCVRAAKQGMDLAGEQAREIEDPDGRSEGEIHDRHVIARAVRRMGVHFQLDADLAQRPRGKAIT